MLTSATGRVVEKSGSIIENIEKESPIETGRQASILASRLNGRLRGGVKLVDMATVVASTGRREIP